jgi:rhamnulokinase
MPEIVQAGTRLGPLLPEIAEAAGLSPGTAVVSPATHDTSGAVAAVPVGGEGSRWAFLSSGTWSMVGVELAEPMISPEALTEGLTNDGCVGGRFRFGKGLVGMWPIEECRRQWESAGDYHSFPRLHSEAQASPAFRTLIDVEDPRLFSPDDMLSTIQTICRERGEPEPRSPGEHFRCLLESLALAYRSTLDSLRRVLGHGIDVLHVVGGGSQSEMLCQMTADACGIPVVAGPVEATAIGNLVIQMIAMNEVASLSEGREIIRDSFPIRVHEPGDRTPWDEACGRVERVTRR